MITRRKNTNDKDNEKCEISYFYLFRPQKHGENVLNLKHIHKNVWFIEQIVLSSTHKKWNCVAAAFYRNVTTNIRTWAVLEILQEHYSVVCRIAISLLFIELYLQCFAYIYRKVHPYLLQREPDSTTQDHITSGGHSAV